jgi:hypothetical protein
MTKIKTDDNRVDATLDGKFHAFWRGQVVYENGRVKRFEAESKAWEFLARCDLA